MSQNPPQIGEHRDDELAEYSRQVLAQAKEEKGVVKITHWIHDGKAFYYVQRHLEDGGWQGTNAPSGYYDADKIFAYYDYSRPEGQERIPSEELKALGWD